MIQLGIAGAISGLAIGIAIGGIGTSYWYSHALENLRLRVSQRDAVARVAVQERNDAEQLAQRTADSLNERNQETEQEYEQRISAMQARLFSASTSVVTIDKPVYLQRIDVKSSGVRELRCPAGDSPGARGDSGGSTGSSVRGQGNTEAEREVYFIAPRSSWLKWSRYIAEQRLAHKKLSEIVREVDGQVNIKLRIEPPQRSF